MWRRLVAFFRRRPQEDTDQLMEAPSLHPGPRAESHVEREANAREREQHRREQIDIERRTRILQAQVHVDAKRFE